MSYKNKKQKKAFTVVTEPLKTSQTHTNVLSESSPSVFLQDAKLFPSETCFVDCARIFNIKQKNLWTAATFNIANIPYLMMKCLQSSCLFCFPFFILNMSCSILPQKQQTKLEDILKEQFLLSVWKLPRKLVFKHSTASKPHLVV